MTIMLVHKMNWEEFLSFSNFRRFWEGYAWHLSLVAFTWADTSSWAFLCWEVFITTSVLPLIGLLGFSISLCIRLVIFLGIYLYIFLGYLTCWGIIIIVISYDPLYFWGKSSNISPFISYFYLSPLFFLVGLAKDLSIF